jgi:hypothetical protein
MEEEDTAEGSYQATTGVTQQAETDIHGFTFEKHDSICIYDWSHDPKFVALSNFSV